MQFLTVDEVANLLGVKAGWVYSRTRDGKLAGTGRGRRSKRKPRIAELPPEAERIPCIKRGKLLRFEREAVLAWFYSGSPALRTLGSCNRNCAATY